MGLWTALTVVRVPLCGLRRPEDRPGPVLTAQLRRHSGERFAGQRCLCSPTTGMCIGPTSWGMATGRVYRTHGALLASLGPERPVAWWWPTGRRLRRLPQPTLTASATSRSWSPPTTGRYYRSAGLGEGDELSFGQFHRPGGGAIRLPGPEGLHLWRLSVERSLPVRRRWQMGTVPACTVASRGLPPPLYPSSFLARGKRNQKDAQETTFSENLP